MTAEIPNIAVRIVLCEPTHPGNIGASARAMKTMGLNELVLVAPRQFPSAEATARASGADDLLESAQVVTTLAGAIDDCAYVVGASARLRSLGWPTMTPRVCAAQLVARSRTNKVAIVFGPEHSGLDNEALARCQALVHIPANPMYSSLNLAMAVQVLCYELRMAEFDPGNDDAGLVEQRDAPLATTAELEGFHAHLEAVMLRAGFLNPEHPRLLKRRLRRLFNRACLDQTEVNILRGLLAAVERSVPDPGRDR